MKLMKSQSEFEQEKRSSLLEFQQTCHNYSRSGWVWASLFVVAMGFGLLLGVNQIPDGVVCRRSNQVCLWLRISQPKKII